MKDTFLEVVTSIFKELEGKRTRKKCSVLARRARLKTVLLVLWVLLALIFVNGKVLAGGVENISLKWGELRSVITGRTIDSLIRTQGIGDFFRIWSLAKRDGLQLEVTWIPDEVHSSLGVEPTEAFDPKYMKALFEFGYRKTLAGETWKDFEAMMSAIDRIVLDEPGDDS